jgi:hypothetical protein
LLLRSDHAVAARDGRVLAATAWSAALLERRDELVRLRHGREDPLIWNTRRYLRGSRPGGYVGYVGVTHGVKLDGLNLFFTGVHLHGGPAPVRRFLPELIQLIWDRTIDPGKVFDLTLPLDEAAEGYKAMDERRATKVLLTL